MAEIFQISNLAIDRLFSRIKAILASEKPGEPDGAKRVEVGKLIIEEQSFAYCAKINVFELLTGNQPVMVNLLNECVYRFQNQNVFAQETSDTPNVG